MGIAALSVAPSTGHPSGRSQRALSIAVRFALGHALLLGFGAAALILLGWSLPIIVERSGEVVGGAVLIALGATGLWAAVSGRIYGHTHAHLGEPSAHWHLHVGLRTRHPAPSSHSHVPMIVGAAFAVSSLRALTMLAPFGESAGGASLTLLLMLVGMFAVGILMSMSLFGVAFARLLSTRAIIRLGRASAALMAAASIVLGGYWAVAALP